MTRPIEEVSVMHDGGSLAGEVYSHPSFAQIGACRVSGRASLYGSDFNHQNYVSIRIAKSVLRRSLSNDWMHADLTPYIEVNLSEAQWANFVTCMNIGGGTACTLRYLGREEIPGLPDPASRKDQFKKEARATCAEALKRIDDLCATVEAMTISKKAKDELIKAARSAGASMTSSLPFVLDQFGEHMELTVEKAKTEINAYVTQNVMRAGLQAIAGGDAATIVLSLNGGAAETPA